MLSYLPYYTPSEIYLGLRLAVFANQEGNICFTELAERVEYGKYGCLNKMNMKTKQESLPTIAEFCFIV